MGNHQSAVWTNFPLQKRPCCLSVPAPSLIKMSECWLCGAHIKAFDAVYMFNDHAFCKEDHRQKSMISSELSCPPSTCSSGRHDLQQDISLTSSESLCPLAPQCASPVDRSKKSSSLDFSSPTEHITVPQTPCPPSPSLSVLSDAITEFEGEQHYDLCPPPIEDVSSRKQHLGAKIVVGLMLVSLCIGNW